MKISRAHAPTYPVKLRWCSADPVEKAVLKLKRYNTHAFGFLRNVIMQAIIYELIMQRLWVHCPLTPTSVHEVYISCVNTMSAVNTEIILLI